MIKFLKWLLGIDELEKFRAGQNTINATFYNSLVTQQPINDSLQKWFHDTDNRIKKLEETRIIDEELSDRRMN